MPSWDSGDDDMITCPHCGHREYPEVGISYHYCPGADARIEEKNREFERVHFGSRRMVRTVIVVEHYDTDACLTSALESIHSRLNHSEADPMLGWQYVVIRDDT